MSVINRRVASRPAIRVPALAGAAVVGALMVIGSPAGAANAHGYSTESGDAVGRPGLKNPAPELRVVQAAGDRVFNQSTPTNRALDNSPAGAYYHDRFGTPNYETPTHGSNGDYQTLLNSPKVLGGAPGKLYDFAQANGAALPDEKDMDATYIRRLSGVPQSDHTHGGTVSEHPHTVSVAATTCGKSVGSTTISAQGTC
ncbi:hypothetical protein ACNO8X_03150 [Mycobacterium sp. PDNC021]|uniref:hypothetical protein n=1 Tax=Mycobacterium sp. PDNC021 TaxID=3391399 RepID=UPI003AB0EAB3